MPSALVPASAQHHRCQGRDEHRKLAGARHLEHRVDREELAFVAHVAGAVESELEDVDVLRGVARRMDVGQAVHPLDHHRMRRPDAQHGPAAAGRLRRQRLLRHGNRMPRIGRHDGGAELDPRRHLAGERGRRQRVQTPRDVGQPSRGEAEVLGLPRVRQERVDVCAQPTRVTDEHSQSHERNLAWDASAARAAPSR